MSGPGEHLLYGTGDPSLHPKKTFEEVLRDLKSDAAFVGAGTFKAGLEVAIEAMQPIFDTLVVLEKEWRVGTGEMHSNSTCADALAAILRTGGKP